MDILQQLADHARERVRLKKEKIPLSMLKERAEQMEKGTFPLEKALSEEGMSFICECKKASPSKGIIAEDFPYLQIAREYEEAGASAISCLTEPKWFLGSDSYLEEIAKKVRIPVLRKDFTVDPYMIYEAKTLGASAVLLIVAILSEEELRSYLQISDELGLSAVVEAHDRKEIETALNAGARIIGVNNRDLHDFSVDIHNSIALRQYIPEDILMIAESGIRTREDIIELEKGKINGVLIGESLMRSPDKKTMLATLRGVRK